MWLVHIGIWILSPHHESIPSRFLFADAFDNELLLSCMEKLKLGQAVDIPIYDFKTHKRVSAYKVVDMLWVDI